MSIDSAMRGLRGVTASGLLLLLAGCAAAPGTGAVASVGGYSAAARLVTVYVATDRVKGPGVGDFTTERSTDIAYARYRISIPPSHVASHVEWPSGSAADPATDFAIVDETSLDETGFTHMLAARSPSPSPSGKRDVAVFVHGYNTTFAESLFRMAQLATDSGIDAAPVLFAWPSRGSLTGYLADKESATFSRDPLARVLTSIATSPGIGGIMLVGHSMGSWLTVEALRQLRLAGRDRVIARLHPIVLAAPDIDPDVFGTQMTAIGRLDPHLTVLVSTDDRALALSAILAGTPGRIGDLRSNPRIDALAATYGVDVVDITSLSTDDAFNHDRFSHSSALLRSVYAGQSGAAMRAVAGMVPTIGAVGDVVMSTVGPRELDANR